MILFNKDCVFSFFNYFIPYKKSGGLFLNIKKVSEDKFEINCSKTEENNVFDKKIQPLRCYEGIITKTFYRILGLSTDITIQGKKYCVNHQDLLNSSFDIAKLFLENYKIKKDWEFKLKENEFFLFEGSILQIDLEKVKDKFLQQFLRKYKKNGFEVEIKKILNNQISLDEKFLLNSIDEKKMMIEY